MQKNKYSKPTVECINITLSHMLAASGDKRDLPWSGKNPDNDDNDYSTTDAF